MRTKETRTFVLFGIRNNELASPFVAAFVEAESFEQASKKLAGTLVDDASDHWQAHTGLSNLVPAENAESVQFEPGPCTIEVLMGLRTDLTTQAQRQQEMRYLHARHDNCLGFVLVTMPTL